MRGKPCQIVDTTDRWNGSTSAAGGFPRATSRAMRVEGRIFADERLHRADPRRPGARAGGQRGLPAGHPDGQPGHARHPLGLRLLHRRRLRRPIRPTGGVISPGGVGYDINCGVRLVRTNLDERGRPAADRTADGRAVSRAFPPASARAARTCSAARNSSGCWARASRYLKTRGLATDGDVEHTEAGGCLRRRRARLRQPAGAGHGAATSAARSARATTSSKCRWSTRCSTTEAAAGHGPRRGHGLRDDPLRLARAGLPGLRRRAARRCATCRRSTASSCPTGSWPAPRSRAPRARQYLGAMRAAANYAWANRQLLMWQTREVVRRVLRPKLGVAAA